MGLFKSYSEKEVKKVMPIIKKINDLEESMAKLKDNELIEKTAEFKQRIAAGETLDEILPEAFATVREASKRPIEFDEDCPELSPALQKAFKSAAAYRNRRRKKLSTLH